MPARNGALSPASWAILLSVSQLVPDHVAQARPFLDSYTGVFILLAPTVVRSYRSGSLATVALLWTLSLRVLYPPISSGDDIGGRSFCDTRPKDHIQAE